MKRKWFTVALSAVATTFLWCGLVALGVSLGKLQVLWFSETDTHVLFGPPGTPVDDHGVSLDVDLDDAGRMHLDMRNDGPFPKRYIVDDLGIVSTNVAATLLPLVERVVPSGQTARFGIRAMTNQQPAQ